MAASDGVKESSRKAYGKDKGTLLCTTHKATTASRGESRNRSHKTEASREARQWFHTEFAGGGKKIIKTSPPVPSLLRAYLHILAQPFERRRLAACPIRCYLLPSQVLHHNALLQREAPVRRKELSDEAAQAMPALCVI